MFEKLTLANGLRVVLEEIPFVRSISFGIWVKNGSRNETISENGLSHFIEHMLFKGTENRTAKEIADEMDAIGGQLNAYTTKEYTAYYTRVLDDHFDIALDIFADMFFHSNFDEAEIEKERNVIFEEINMYEDSPEELVHESIQSAVWENDSLGYSILGTEETISAFSRQSFLDYCEKHYCPENTVIAIAGNFKKADILKRIEKYFAGFQRSADYHAPVFHTDYKTAIVTKEKDIEQLHLCLSFPGIGIGTADAYTLSALNTLFGGGMSSRLFQNIREDKGLVYSIYSYAANHTGTGLFAIYAALNPAQCSDAMALIIDEIKKIRTEKVDDKTLRNTKEQLKSNYMLGLESSSNRMSNIGRSELLLGRILSDDESIDKIEAVTKDDVHGLCGRIFDLNRLSLSAVGRTQGMDFERMIRDAGK
ncbi:MAG: insulinase family protein [Clostridiales bacterium]|jgi:predicted Zn-dependent peptidase|nr:insulinase family protein [Clostridiales bacterium]